MTVQGSLVNHLLATETPVKPEVGMGATILSYSDRYPATIIKVTPKTVTVQADQWERTDDNGMSEEQDYIYTRDPKAQTEVYRQTKKGWRDRSGRYLSIGRRERYYDFSF